MSGRSSSFPGPPSITSAPRPPEIRSLPSSPRSRSGACCRRSCRSRLPPRRHRRRWSRGTWSPQITSSPPNAWIVSFPAPPEQGVVQVAAGECLRSAAADHPAALARIGGSRRRPGRHHLAIAEAGRAGVAAVDVDGVVARAAGDQRLRQRARRLDRVDRRRCRGRPRSCPGRSSRSRCRRPGRRTGDPRRCRRRGGRCRRRRSPRRRPARRPRRRCRRPPNPRSRPKPPVRVSLPGPPSMRSSPESPSIRSFPPPPRIAVAGRAALDAIVAGLAEQAVAGLVAHDGVVAAAAAERVAPGPSGRRVVTGAAEDTVAGAAAVHGVREPLPRIRSLPLEPKNDVRAPSAGASEARAKRGGQHKSCDKACGGTQRTLHSLFFAAKGRDSSMSAYEVSCRARAPSPNRIWLRVGHRCGRLAPGRHTWRPMGPPLRGATGDRGLGELGGI